MYYLTLLFNWINKNELNKKRRQKYETLKYKFYLIFKCNI